MPQRLLSPADQLCRLASDFQSGDPIQASSLKKEFKEKSKNDLSRVVVYLMEVVGSRDQQFKAIQAENKDLKELLKLNNISIEDNEDGSTQTNTNEAIGERKSEEAIAASVQNT